MGVDAGVGVKGHSRIHTGIRNLLSNVVKHRVWIQVQLQRVRAHGLQRHTHRPGKAGRRIRNEAPASFCSTATAGSEEELELGKKESTYFSGQN